MFSERKQLAVEIPANQVAQAVSSQALQANQAKQPSPYKCDTSAQATIRSLVVTTRGYERSKSVTKSKDGVKVKTQLSVRACSISRAADLTRLPSHTHKSRDRSVRSPSTKRRRSPSKKRRHSRSPTLRHRHTRSPSHNHRRHRSASRKRHRSRDNSKKSYRDTPPRDMRRGWKYQ